MTQKTVAIIGGGMAGYTTMQSFKSRGIEPVTFEKQEEGGGLWNLDSGAMWKDMIVNISRYHMNFPHFAWKSNKPDFPSRYETARYLNDFKNHYDLEDHIYYGHQVTSVTYHRRSRKYRLGIETLSGKETFETDFVVNAGGIFKQKNMPKLKHRREYQNPVLHSSEYKNGRDYSGKTIIVIGSGMSGIEISADAAKHGAKVINIANRNCWIVKRSINGVPSDMLTYHYPMPGDLTGREAHLDRCNRIEKAFGNPGDAHPALYVDKNSNDPFLAAVSDDYIDYVTSDAITPYRGDPIIRLTKRGVLLASGTELYADAIIAGTGSTADLDFLDDNMKAAIYYDKNDMLQPVILPFATLTKGYKTLYHVAQERGPWMLNTYLQGELAASLASGETKYPSSKKIAQSMQEQLNIRNAYPRPQFPQNYVGHALELAGLMGRLPKDLLQQAKTDKVPVCPADFMRFGPQSNFDYAEEQRQIFLQRRNSYD